MQKLIIPLFLCSKTLTGSLLPLTVNEILTMSFDLLSSFALNNSLHIPRNPSNLQNAYTFHAFVILSLKNSYFFICACKILSTIQVLIQIPPPLESVTESDRKIELLPPWDFALLTMHALLKLNSKYLSL